MDILKQNVHNSLFKGRDIGKYGDGEMGYRELGRYDNGEGEGEGYGEG